MNTWTAEQLGSFLDSTRERRLHELFVTAATTALRRGELLGLRWDDVDLDAARIAVRRSRTSVGYEVIEATPKTRKGIRTVDLDSETVSALRRWRARRLRDRMAWGSAWTDCGLVFTHEDGSGLHPITLPTLSTPRYVVRASRSSAFMTCVIHGPRSRFEPESIPKLSVSASVTPRSDLPSTRTPTPYPVGKRRLQPR